MKLRSITLHNVRKFQNTRATISGITDGITTICAPNESGKSTFFDALHALFFYPHSGQSQEIKSLQPYSKGPVEISVDIEDDQGHPWRIEKRYLSSKSAVITDLETGRIHAQADEAEDWIRKLIGSDMHGPTGLLWVRQGITGFGPDGSGTKEKNEREKLRETRQGLMSSVAGQIDNVTGGKRMDSIMKACVSDLEALATKTGGPKAGGEWGKAVKDMQDLEATETRLAEQVQELSEALKEHADLKRALAAAENQTLIHERDEAIRLAQAALDAALTHEAKINEAKRDLRLCELEAQQHSDRISASNRAMDLKRDLEQAALVASRASKAAAEDVDRLQQDLEKAGQEHMQAQAVLEKARSDLALAHSMQDALRAARRRKEIESVLEKIAAHEEVRKKSAAIQRDNPVTPDILNGLEDMFRSLISAQAARDASAASLRVSYSGTSRLHIENTDIAGDTDISLTRNLDIEMPGIGKLHLTPAATSGHLDPNTIFLDFKAKIADLGAQSIDQVRTMARDRQNAANAEALARQSIETLAPEGTDVLRRELEDLPEVEILTNKAVDIDMLKSNVEAFEAIERKGVLALDEARRRHAEALEVAAGAKAEERIASEQARTLPSDILTEQDHALEDQKLKEASQKSLEISKSIEALEKEAPDKDALEAELSRLTSAKNNAAQERERQQKRLYELGGIIRARAEDNAEARLAETRGMLEKVKAREARYRFEVQALSELKTRLEEARQEARDAYFEPVKKEIGPLLSMLHEDANLEMDSETMLPSRIIRKGMAEEIDVLSGGASEQIAILTRLAFARLYAQSGRQVPIILDDALVHSDDARIVRMFTALTRMAKNQQIIVFSCRTRAFSELGGTQCSIQAQGTM
jgi:hypothetical protein